MKLLFKQRLFSWLDSYDIYYEDGSTAYTVHGKMSWGHCLEIFNQNEQYVGRVKEEVLTFLPRFHMYLGEEYIGEIRKELTFLRDSFQLDCKGWTVQGDFWDWDYVICDGSGVAVAQISKQFLNFTDTYEIEVANPDHALISLMVVLAIDAVRCSSSNN